VKLLLGLFEKSRGHFEDGGKLRAARPLFDAMENFFFAPKTRTPSMPHVRDAMDIKRYMSMVIIALLPCVAAAIYFFGLRVIPIIVVSYVAGGAVEVLFAIVRKEEINEGFLVTGLIFPLILPVTVPLWMVAVGVAFGVLVGKELFGGTGRNVFNPAIVGRCFLALAYPAAMTGGWVMPGETWTGRVFQYVGGGQVPDAVTGATPLGQAKAGELASFWDLLAGSVGGCIGETSAALIIAGGLFLLFTRVANWRTVLSILVGAGVMAAALHMRDGETFAPASWHLLAGGLLFGAFFMATDPVTSPVTNRGKWVYGLLIGVVAILIRNFTAFVEGVMFAILLGNIAAPVIDQVVIGMHQRRLANEG